MSMKIARSAQFDSFLTFAGKAVAAGDGKAVVRTTGESGYFGGVEACKVAAVKTDKAYAFRRNQTEKTANNAVRELFRKSVADLFGGDDKIPAGVRNAMLMKDYGVGKPLTARRIMAVKAAIDKAIGETPVKMTRALAAAEVAKAATRCLERNHAAVERGEFVTKLSITPGQQAKAAALVARYGRGMNAKNVALLANYAVYIVGYGNVADPDAAVARIARDIAKFRDFHPGDMRFKDVDAKVCVHARAALADTLGKARDFDEDGVFTAMVADSSRATFVIDGREIEFGDGGKVLGAFKDAVKGEQARKVLSTFLCQATGGTIVSIAQGFPLPKNATYPKGLDVMKTKGVELYVSNDCTTEDRFYSAPFAQVKNSKYMLEFDRKTQTATVSVVSTGDLVVPISEDLNNMNNKAGSFEWTLQYKFDMTSDEPRLLDAHIGQTIEV